MTVISLADELVNNIQHNRILTYPWIRVTTDHRGIVWIIHP